MLKPSSAAIVEYVQASFGQLLPELLKEMLAYEGVEGEELQRLTEDGMRDLSGPAVEGMHLKYIVTITKKP